MQFLKDYRSNTCQNGVGDLQVVERPDAIKTILVRWSKVKTDLNELARLRWIKKLTIPEISKELNRSRVHIRRSIRTLRNSGLSQLNLTDLEKIKIETAIIRGD